MRTLQPQRSALLLIDLQARLVPAIDGGDAMVANARRLAELARMFAIPVLLTEQNPAKLGATVAALATPETTLAKMTFDGCGAPGFDAALPDRPDVVIAGCETHVCVLQTALGLLDRDRRVYVVADAVGSRTPANREAGLRRMERHGAEIVTTEMVAFEWIGSCADPRFRDAMALIK